MKHLLVEIPHILGVDTKKIFSFYVNFTCILRVNSVKNITEICFTRLVL